MHTISFDCTVLTPTFLGGINPSKSAELRVPSIRGVLRWWYRALLAGRGHNLASLKEREAEVFGDTTRASAVRLRLSHMETSDVSKSWSEMSDALQSGADYLWHFAKANERSFLPHGLSFRLTASALPGERAALEEMTRAFWLLVHLGGLGSRSRRMAGAFVVDNVVSTENLEIPDFTPPVSFNDWFSNQLRAIVPESSSPEASLIQNGVAALHTSTVHVQRFSSNETWQQTVEQVGRDYKEVRDHYNDEEQIHRRVALGLPLAKGDDDDEPWNVTAGENKIPLERRASALILQAVRLSSGSVAGVGTVFCSSFAPPPVDVENAGFFSSPRQAAKLIFDSSDHNPTLNNLY